MVQINSIRKVDYVGRTTIPPLVLQLLHIERGIDHIYWSVEDGKMVLRKVTRMYYGLDPETEDIESTLRSYENNVGIDLSESTEGMSPEEIRRLATDAYLRDRSKRRRSDPRHGSKHRRDEPFAAAKESYRRAKSYEDS